jgi:hypothetical protein
MAKTGRLSPGRGPRAPRPRPAPSRARPRARPSVRLDLAEAVRAVDRSIHTRLERHLRLVAARGADDGEILAGGPVVASLVATGPADFADVVAGVARRAAARSAARAALWVRCEPLLCVELLICGGMNEFHPTVDTLDRSVDVGHGACSSPARCREIAGLSCGPDRPIGGRDVRWREKPGPRDPRCRYEVPDRGAPVVRGAGYNDLREKAVEGEESERKPGTEEAPSDRSRSSDSQPVTMTRDIPGRRARANGGSSLAPVLRPDGPSSRRRSGV